MDPDHPLLNLLDMQANIFSDISFISVATRTDKENQSIITNCKCGHASNCSIQTERVIKDKTRYSCVELSQKEKLSKEVKHIFVQAVKLLVYCRECFLLTLKRKNV